ncbi:hypothetical protein ABZX40_16550 [Streptomyces sp. NPDC004610]|uniref:hypothetical protein n=1 Tax=unclassified Streptomyces TaxID=2593676 RepID=UPI0033A51720
MNPRLLALAGLAVCAVVLPLAVASAGPVGGEGGTRGETLVRQNESEDEGDVSGGERVDPKAPAGTTDGAAVPPSAPTPTPAVSGSPLTLGLGLATAARCGPELTSPDGIEAQTCVLTQGEDTWARTYYRNATGDALTAVLTLMGPGGRTVTLRCPVGGGDEPAECSTPRERTRGALEHYSAVAEFADAAGTGPSLLRSGSNSARPASG